MRQQGFDAQLTLPFQVENWLNVKVKTSNISGTMPKIFIILSPYAWKNNVLENKNYYDDLDIIDQGHSKGYISQFWLYIGYSLTNFIIISTTMMVSYIAASNNKNVISSDLENVGQSHHLQKWLYLSYYMTDFCQNLIEMMAMLSNKNYISCPWKCNSRSPFTKKILHLGYYTTDFNQTFIKPAIYLWFTDLDSIYLRPASLTKELCHQVIGILFGQIKHVPIYKFQDGCQLIWHDNYYVTFVRKHV